MSIDYEQLKDFVKEAMFTGGGINEPSAPEGIPHRMPGSETEEPEQDKGDPVANDMYDVALAAREATEALVEALDDPTFDAANVLKFNNHLLYLVSSTGNLAGARWLQECVGSDFEVVTWEDIYAFAHIDSTIHSLDERTIAINSERVSEENIPAFLRDHRKVWVNEMAHSDFHVFPFASVWIGFNMLSISPETIIVDSIQKQLTKQLQDNKFKVLNVANRHSRTLGGGFHCMTCDLEREHE